jgi:acyl-CoA reductase-like NAD-dependent aldehyde dehydrogenase
VEQQGQSTVVSIRGNRADSRPLIADARLAQSSWAELSLSARLAVIRRFRDRLAAESSEIARSITKRPVTESLTGEILPLLEACRYLERNAARVLQYERRRGRGAAWLRGITVAVAHEAYGVVLIVGPSNYGLMLPGIQALQALVAGNAVIIKPAPGSQETLGHFAALLEQSGLPRGLIAIVDDSVETAHELLAGLVDKVVFTGSSSVGRSVLARASEYLVPATVELSGWDACIVLESADLDRTARAIAFALRFNDGATCLAPRRILVPPDRRDELVARLVAALEAGGAAAFSPASLPGAIDLVEDAIRRGARLAHGNISRNSMTGPLLLTHVTDGMPIFSTEIFGPIALVAEAADTDDAIAQAHATPYALGATVFGAQAEALAVASRLNVGVVMINDAVAPAAHPALPIAARGASGFGATRGPEGLLEFTRPKAIVLNAARRPFHLAPRRKTDEALLGAYIGAAHRISWFNRIRAALTAVSAVRGRRLEEKT